jgi:hypothetical protein
MIRFTGYTHDEPIPVNIPYRAVYDEELTLALGDAIGALVCAVGAARGKDLSDDPEELRWMKEFLIGFALLAIGEARSVIMLLSDGLSRHARVHMRALFEYELRVKLLAKEPRRALEVRDSIAFEMRKVGYGLGGSPETTEQQIAEALGITDASKIIGTKESDAFGGTVRSQMKDEIWPERRYFGSFAGMSWVSHGSILAIREVSRAVRDAGSDLLRCAADDGNGNDWLHHAAWILLKLTGLTQEHFGIEVPGAQAAAARLVRANQRLGIVTKAHEAAAEDALAARQAKNDTL